MLTKWSGRPRDQRPLTLPMPTAAGDLTRDGTRMLSWACCIYMYMYMSMYMYMFMYRHVYRRLSPRMAPFRVTFPFRERPR